MSKEHKLKHTLGIPLDQPFPPEWDHYNVRPVNEGSRSSILLSSNPYGAIREPSQVEDEVSSMRPPRPTGLSAQIPAIARVQTSESALQQDLTPGITQEGFNRWLNVPSAPVIQDEPQRSTSQSGSTLGVTRDDTIRQPLGSSLTGPRTSVGDSNTPVASIGARGTRSKMAARQQQEADDLKMAKQLQADDFSAAHQGPASRPSHDPKSDDSSLSSMHTRTSASKSGKSAAAIHAASTTDLGDQEERPVDPRGSRPKTTRTQQEEDDFNLAKQMELYERNSADQADSDSDEEEPVYKPGRKSGSKRFTRSPSAESASAPPRKRSRRGTGVVASSSTAPSGPAISSSVSAGASSSGASLRSLRAIRRSDRMAAGELAEDMDQEANTLPVVMPPRLFPSKGKGKAKATSPLSRLPVDSDVTPAVLRSELGPDRTLEQMQADFLQVKDDFNVTSNPHLYYADKLREFLANTEILRKVTPTRPAEQAKALSTIFDLPVLPGVNDGLRPGRKITKTNEARRILIYKSTSTITAQVSFILIPEDEPDGDAKFMALINRALQVLRRFPFTTVIMATLNVIMRCIYHTEFDAPKIIFLPSVENKEHDLAYMRVMVRCVDPHTGDIVSHAFRQSSYDWDDVKYEDIPVVDHLCRYVSGAHEVEVAQASRDFDDVTSLPRTPTVLTAGDVAKYGQNMVKLEKFLRYASFELSDMLVTEEGLMTMFENLLYEVGFPTTGGREKLGAYGGHTLCKARTDKRRRRVEYYFSAAVKNDLGGLPSKKYRQIAAVRTLSGMLVSIPLDVGLKHFHRTGDPRVAGLYLAEAADEVNSELLTGQEDSFACGCDEAMSQALIHHCNSCQLPRVCSSLVAHGAARICKRCKRKLASGARDDTVQVVMEHSLSRNHRGECKVLGKDPDSTDEKIRFDRMCLRVIDNYLEDTKWSDDYAAEIPREMAGIADVRAFRDPFVCSVDAIEPYGLSHDETLRIHTALNIAMTTSGYNYMKQRQLIGYLVELAKYDCSVSHSQLEKDEFERICNDLYIVAAKIPYTKKARAHGTDLNDLQADQAEWRAGVPVQGEAGPWDQTLWRWLPEPTSNKWDSETIKRLSHIVDQIEAKYNVRLQRAADGAPWPYKEGSSIQNMPQGWSWACWGSMMSFRLRRMRTKCNRHGASKYSSVARIIPSSDC
jgi:hypothetical protein